MDFLSILFANDNIIECGGQNYSHKAIKVVNQMKQKKYSPKLIRFKENLFKPKTQIVRNSEINESVNETSRNEEKIARDKQNLERQLKDIRRCQFQSFTISEHFYPQFIHQQKQSYQKIINT